jgi:hypothetical protein
MTTTGRPSADELEEYRVRQEREDARLRAVYENHEFIAAARQGIARWQAGDRSGVITLEEFAKKYGLPRP